MARRPTGMHRPAVDAAPALHPDLFGESVKEAADIPMPPEPAPAAARTARRPRPWKALAKAYDVWHTNRYG